MHTLIAGNQDTQRSAFVDRLLQESNIELPIYGFRTTFGAADSDGVSPIHIHSTTGPRLYSGENLVGFCREQRATAFLEVFENHAYLLESVHPGGIILMDELGPMEGKATRFRSAVFACLDGDIPVLASVRDKDTPFLNSVRQHPKARCFLMGGDEAALFTEALTFFKAQLPGDGL